MPLVGNPADWATDTQQGLIREALSAFPALNHERSKCVACDTAWRSLVPSLGTDPLRFYRNPKAGESGRQELPHGKDRSKRLRHKVYEVHAYMADPVPAPEPVPAPRPRPVRPTAPTGLSDAHKRFLIEVRRIRAFAEERGVDHISYRPIKDGARMISQGIPVEACLHAMTMHWEAATRRQAGIRDYDPAREFPGGLDAYLRALVNAGVLIMLTGPAGMGKSYWCEKLAEDLGVPFGSIPCNEQATPSWLIGKETMSGFKGTEFLQIWSEGGVFLFDEMDACDSNFLMTVNNALANGLLKNPVDQQTYRRSEMAIIMAATNTLGTGADAEYTARNALDFSTLDRFRMGRAYVGYSASIEEAILASHA